MRSRSLLSAAFLADLANRALASPITPSIALRVFPLYDANHNDDDDNNNDTPLPLVIWHGLGDASTSEGITAVIDLAQAINPGTLVYAISLAPDANADRQATFFGNLTSQLQAVCDALAAHPILSTAPAIDALGFSQGGQFLRGYVERCNDPPVRSLVTFGSQHNGISQFKTCSTMDFLCRGAMALLRSNTWSDAVQSRLVPAQYFRDPLGDYDAYLEHSNFLADINNERPLERNPRYRENIMSLTNFVMYLFEDDTTVIPKESAWFSDAAEGGNITPLRETRMYSEDWLGLKHLDDKGALRFRSVAGEHMQIPPGVLNETVRDFFGPLYKAFKREPRPQEEEEEEEAPRTDL